MDETRRKRIFDDNEKYWKILANIEETNQCSGGLCPSSESDFLPIYLFSNVNDGVPNKSCHESLSDLIESNLS